MPNLEDPADEVQVDAELEPLEESNEPAPELEPTPEPKPNAHPLAPGGKRFEQIYAQSKQAQRDLAEERERRIAAEAQLQVLAKPQANTDSNKEYTWAELDKFIAEGRITRADAEQHREDVLARKLSTKLRDDFDRETRTASRENTLTQSIVDYIKVAPLLTTPGSVDRQRVDREFDWLASVQGVDTAKITPVERKALELTALRNVYGPIESFTKKGKTRVETQQEMPGGSPPSNERNPDQAILDALTKPQVAHYRKMMSTGRYPGGWKEVVEELKYVPGQKAKAK
jgi:hypothetical protein